MPMFAVRTPVTNSSGLGKILFASCLVPLLFPFQTVLLRNFRIIYI